MRREAGGHENFFIAKIRDSESAQAGFGADRAIATVTIARRSPNALISKTTAAQPFLALLTIAGIAFARTIREYARIRCGVAEARTARVTTLPRQHFLKRDAVFLSVLVYSGCSASRFPSARSD
jgi:hypothetical protein